MGIGIDRYIHFHWRRRIRKTKHSRIVVPVFLVKPDAISEFIWYYSIVARQVSGFLKPGVKQEEELIFAGMYQYLFYQVLQQYSSAAFVDE